MSVRIVVDGINLIIIALTQRITANHIFIIIIVALILRPSRRRR